MTKGGDGRRVGTYDLSSIMHYRSRQYTKNGKPTILAKSGVALSGSVLTPTDIATVNMLVKERSVRGPGGRQPQSTRTR
jgi:hypothetical protein